MRLEDLEKQEAEKPKETTALVRRTPLTSPAHAGISVPHDSIEEWEHFMEYGYLPRDFHGF